MSEKTIYLGEEEYVEYSFLLAPSTKKQVCKTYSEDIF